MTSVSGASDGPRTGESSSGQLTRWGVRRTTTKLSRREWGNVGLVTLFSQGVQIAIVSVLIGAFFILLGVLLVSEATTTSWAGEANVLTAFTTGNRQLVITEELLRVAGFLTAFSGLNFTVYLLTDQAYRAEFRGEVVGELRQAFAVRAAYRDAVGEPAFAK